MVQFRFAALDEADITKSSQADGRRSNGLTYKDAGVDIDAGNALVDAIKPLARSTVRPGADADLGGFGGLFDLKTAGYADPILVACNDGVGTKVLLANEVGKHDTIGIDLVAMCVNDLVVQGAEPLFFLDYFSTGRLDLDRAQAVLEGITAGCREAACALIGGETAEMPGLYGETEYDLAGFAVGAVERGRVLPQAVAAGDVVIGLPSSGFHSNGYSLIRKVMDLSDNRYDMPEPDGSGSTLGEALLAPTRIYVKACLALVKAGLAKGFAHITGGGLIENIPRALPVTLAVNIDTDHLPLPPLMAWLAEAGGLPSAEMVRTFNCGIGMVALVSSEHEDLAMTALADAGERPQRLGRVVEREGGGQVILDGLSQAWGLP